MKQFLGIDYGDKRVGLSSGNDVVKLATPLKIIENNNQLWQSLQDILSVSEYAAIVVGLPRGLDGQETPQTVKVRQFAQELEQRLKLEVILQDEAATSVVVSEQIKQPNQAVDSMAAALILQDYLTTL